MAVVGGIIILIAYMVAVFAEFVAPFDPEYRDEKSPFVPPMKIHFTTEGKLHFPSVYALSQIRDEVTLRVHYVEDKTKRYQIRLFVHGDPYRLWNIVGSNLHLFGTKEGQRPYFLGTDQQGRDLLSRIIYGTRISMSIGLVGVTISFVLAIMLGGISGYLGGISDTIIQRVIEVLTSIPSLPLWMALAVAIPISWPITRVFFVITIILSLISWPTLARQVRGMILALKETAYIDAAILDNVVTRRLIGSYFLPAVLSHLIASLTLSVPGMILGETALSFLGIGLHPPAISWGVLLQDAQNIQTVALSSWLILPVIPIVIVVLAFNFLGDGLRDAADPYRS